MSIISVPDDGHVGDEASVEMSKPGGPTPAAAFEAEAEALVDHWKQLYPKYAVGEWPIRHLVLAINDALLQAHTAALAAAEQVIASTLDPTGGSTGNAYGTQQRILEAVQRLRGASDGH